MSMHDISGYLDTAELYELSEQIARRAEAVERGEPAPAHVQHVDIRTTGTWQRFLRSNPDFLKHHPHYLADVKGEPEA